MPPGSLANQGIFSASPRCMCLSTMTCLHQNVDAVESVACCRSGRTTLALTCPRKELAQTARSRPQSNFFPQSKGHEEPSLLSLSVSPHETERHAGAVDESRPGLGRCRAAKARGLLWLAVTGREDEGFWELWQLPAAKSSGRHFLAAFSVWPVS